MASRSRRLVELSALLLAGACCLAAQSKKPEDLAVGKMLVTPRHAPDPLFAESVILLVRYDETGALGLMVNRRTTVPISRALRELDGAAAHSDPVFVGGPVQLEMVFALCLRRREFERNEWLPAINSNCDSRPETLSNSRLRRRNRVSFGR
jgi:putative AlgH/UPF0301 family transcriptional regulator